MSFRDFDNLPGLANLCSLFSAYQCFIKEASRKYSVMIVNLLIVNRCNEDHKRSLCENNLIPCQKVEFKRNNQIIAALKVKALFKIGWKENWLKVYLFFLKYFTQISNIGTCVNITCHKG